MWKIIAMLFVPVLAHAELSATTQYLTNERATLLDIGLMRLGTLTSEFERRVGVHWTDKGTARLFRPEINALYEPNDDKVYVYFSVMDSTPTDEQMAEDCENAMTQMNIWLRKALPQLFLHMGVQRSFRAGRATASVVRNVRAALLFFFGTRFLGGKILGKPEPWGHPDEDRQMEDA